MDKHFKTIGSIVVALDTIYLVWLAFNVTGLGYLLVFAELMIASLTYLLVINHWSQDHVFEHHREPRGTVDVFIPVVNEPLDMMENTIRAASNIDYAQKKVYLLDDGNRPELQTMAQRYGVTYLARPAQRKHNKAGNLNFGLEHSNGDYVLVIDADHVVQSHVVKDLLGHFDDDSKVAIVATRQAFLVPEGDFNHDVIFYNHMQAGKNSDNSSISCGNGVFYRRSALQEINGFQTWNLVEDLYTSYVLHLNGYRTVYINQPYTYGTAPLDLSGIYKQRGTWALDTLRIFFWHSPLFVKGLNLRQRLHYFEMGWAYIVSAVSMPIVFLLPAVAVLTNDPIVTDPLTYLLLRIPSLLAVIYFYYKLSGGMFSQMQMWSSLFPVYLKALVLSLAGVVTKYKVTAKISHGQREIAYVIPHLLVVAFSLFVVVRQIFFIDYAITSHVGINLMWMTLMFFWFAPVIQKGFQRAGSRVEQTALIQQAIEATSMGLLAILIGYSFQQAFTPHANPALTSAPVVQAQVIEHLPSAPSIDIAGESR